MIIDISELFVSWHMIIKDELEVTLRSLDSLQGVYDENIVAVDSDPSQDELYERIKVYPNTFVYRQKWHDRFDVARQDALDRVSKKAVYIGWSDSDEELVTPTPREIREYLYDKRPPSVNICLRYLQKVGPCEPGDYFRVRMWRTDEPRVWRDAVHEYPDYQGTTNSALADNKYDIVFNHLRAGDGDYRADFNIKSMINDLKQGGTWRLPRLSGECRGVGRYKEALDFARQGVSISARFDIMNDSMKELLLVCNDLGDQWTLVKFHLLDLMNLKPELKETPFVLEYLALSYYYTKDIDSARELHEKAKRLDPDKTLKFIMENDGFFNKQ